MTTLFEVGGVAKATPFDNSTNGFIATNVQAAIEEVRFVAESKRLVLTLTNNGTLANGNWITYSELLANPRILFPIKVRLKELSWVNNNVNLGAFDFVCYKNGQAAGNIIYTYSAPAADRTVGYGYHLIPNAFDFLPGESLYIKYVKPSGTSLADLALLVYIERIV
jgi:hypothetical protein